MLTVWMKKFVLGIMYIYIRGWGVFFFFNLLTRNTCLFDFEKVKTKRKKKNKKVKDIFQTRFVFFLGKKNIYKR